MAALVSDLKKDQPDMAGDVVLEIYAIVTGKYAVYRTARRVMIQFADDDEHGVEQRAVLAPLEQIRGEISAMMDGWRDARLVVDRNARALREAGFNRRTADGLIAALRGFAEPAVQVLTGVRDDIKAERQSIGRLYYLLMAAASVLLWALVLWGLQSLGTQTLADFLTRNDIPMAAEFGSWGALFSIALAIRGRQIQSDMVNRDNLVDANLRISIGAVSAVILFAMLKGHLVAISFGTTALAVETPVGPVALVIGILAGFSERLVGNFLDTASIAASTAAAVNGPAPVNPATGAAADRSLLTHDEDNPAGRSLAADVAMLDDGHDHPEAAVDACLCQTPINPAEATKDTELPASYGGVESEATK